jgi:hypothetical protein
VRYKPIENKKKREVKRIENIFFITIPPTKYIFYFTMKKAAYPGGFLSGYCSEF